MTSTSTASTPRDSFGAMVGNLVESFPMEMNGRNNISELGKILFSETTSTPPRHHTSSLTPQQPPVSGLSTHRLLESQFPAGESADNKRTRPSPRATPSDIFNGMSASEFQLTVSQQHASSSDQQRHSPHGLHAANNTSAYPYKHPLNAHHQHSPTSQPHNNNIHNHAFDLVIQNSPRLGSNPVSKVMKTKGKATPMRWSGAEDEALRQAVYNHGERNWKSIAEEVYGRNHTQCLQRWTKVLAPGLVKGHWRPDEDEQLRKLVAEGRKNWGQVATRITGRTSKQCRERWYNHLDPTIVRGEYTNEEDRIIIAEQKAIGNRWSAISAKLPGRTEDAVKIRWKSLSRYKNNPNSVFISRNSLNSATPLHHMHQHTSNSPSHSSSLSGQQPIPLPLPGLPMAASSDQAIMNQKPKLSSTQLSSSHQQQQQHSQRLVQQQKQEQSLRLSKQHQSQRSSQLLSGSQHPHPGAPLNSSQQASIQNMQEQAHAQYMQQQHHRIASSQRAAASAHQSQSSSPHYSMGPPSSHMSTTTSTSQSHPHPQQYYTQQNVSQSGHYNMSSGYATGGGESSSSYQHHSLLGSSNGHDNGSSATANTTSRPHEQQQQHQTGLSHQTILSHPHFPSSQLPHSSSSLHHHNSSTPHPYSNNGLSQQSHQPFAQQREQRSMKPSSSALLGHHYFPPSASTNGATNGHGMSLSSQSNSTSSNSNNVSQSLQGFQHSTSKLSQQQQQQPPMSSQLPHPLRSQMAWQHTPHTGVTGSRPPPRDNTSEPMTSSSSMMMMSSASSGRLPPRPASNVTRTPGTAQSPNPAAAFYRSLSSRTSSGSIRSSSNGSNGSLTKDDLPPPLMTTSMTGGTMAMTDNLIRPNSIKSEVSLSAVGGLGTSMTTSTSSPPSVNLGILKGIKHESSATGSLPQAPPHSLQPPPLTLSIAFNNNTNGSTSQPMSSTSNMIDTLARASFARRSGHGSSAFDVPRLSGRNSIEGFLNDLSDVGRISDIDLGELGNMDEVWRMSSDMNRLSL